MIFKSVYSLSPIMASKYVRIWIILTYLVIIYADNSFKWKCHNYSINKQEKCIAVEYENKNYTIQCRVCDHYNEYIFNLTICDTTEFKVTITMILNAVPEDIERLVVRYSNKWNGYLPLQPDPIVLDGLRRLTNLKYFHLNDVSYKYFQLYPIKISETTLEKLSNVTSLLIRIPVVDNQKVRLGDVVKKLPYLELLDLSYTRGISANSLIYLLQNINHNNIKHLCLRKHQLIGGDGYVSDYSQILTSINVSFPNLIELDISDNTIARMPPGISNMAPNLQKFDISGNMMLDTSNMALVFESFMHPTIIVLNAGFQGFKGRNPDPVVHSPIFDQCDIGSDYVHSNILQDLNNNEKSLEDLKKRQLQVLVNCMNEASGGDISRAVNSSLITCKFIVCLLPTFFQEINCTSQKFLPVLATVFNIDCMLHMNLPIGDNLEEFYFSEVHLEQAQTIGFKLSGTLCLKKENNLKKLFANSNEFWMQSAQLGTIVTSMDGVSGFDKLQYISLSNNSVSPQENISRFFNGILPTVEVVDLSGNSINYPNFCRVIPNVVSLNLQNSNLSKVSSDLVVNCSKLEVLMLGYNKIDVRCLNSIDFEGVHGLTWIEFQWCDIHIFEREFLKKIDAYANLTIDLSNNPMHCNCNEESQNFARWIIASKAKLLNYEKYYCDGPGGLVFFDNINPDTFWYHCHTYSLRMVIESVATTLSVVILLVMFSGMYKIRWRIKYWTFCLEQFFKMKFPKGGNKPTKMWKYDAFISYCAENRFWVHETLMKTLENTYGFQLCIHYRDFPLGADVAETISEMMKISREIIIVISDVALKSNWCQFKLDEALMQVYRRQQRLIVIKLGKIKPHLLNSKVAHILENHTFMEWSDKIEHHKLFWAKLVAELYNNPEGGCFICCPYGTRSLGYKDILDPKLDTAYTVEEEQEEQAVQTLSPYSKGCWETAQRAKNNARRAKGYSRKLQHVLAGEDLPNWTYGPVPMAIDSLLQDDKQQFEEQTYQHATDKINLMISCLDKHYKTEVGVYRTQIQKIKDDDSISGNCNHILTRVDSDED